MTNYLRISPRPTKEKIAQANQTFLAGPQPSDAEQALAHCEAELDALSTPELFGRLIEKWIAEIEGALHEPLSPACCYSCGSDINTLTPCPCCGVLLCQDCDDIHVCDPDLAADYCEED
jgi:hypothetical protein